MVPILALFTGLLATLAGGRAPEPPPPTRAPAAAIRGNVLILVADDLGIDQLAAYGVAPDPAPTPTLDLMAAVGVRFTNVWAEPTCSPTRATIQTGRYAFRTTVGAAINAFGDVPSLPLSEVTLPEMLDLGTGGLYAHAAIGKWHLGSNETGGDFAPNLAGYSHFAGSLEGQIQNYFSWHRIVDGVPSTSRRYATTVCVDDALAWIRLQSGPWLCVVNFQAPHAPFHRPPDGLHTQLLPPQDPRPGCSVPGGDPRPFYKATVEALDHEIGRLVTQLPAGQLQRTTVFFLGDNGTDPCVAGAPFAPQNKGTLYEGGVRVPLIVAGKGVTGRGTCDALVNTTDLFATVAELARVDLAATLPGVTLDAVSFAPCLADPTLAGARTWLYADSFAENGPGNPPSLPPCPPGGVCQTSLGFDGPGTAVLASCGPPLYGAFGANLVPWQLSGAPPSADAWLLIGAHAPTFQPQLGATLVPWPPTYFAHYVTDPSGTLAGTIWTADTTSERNYQFVVRDASLPRGYSVTNALEMELLPGYQRAVRDARYALIRFDPCHEELYDLVLDPFQHTDLLARTLSLEEAAVHNTLGARLDALH